MALEVPLLKLKQDGSLPLIRRLFAETGREFLGRYVLVIALAVVIGASTALNAWIIKDLINLVFFDRRQDMLFLLTGIVVANGFVRGASLYASAITIGRIGNAVVGANRGPGP